MLGVHVLGPGFGETIIIELPVAKFVIDSFTAPHTGPPALEFLRVNFPALTKLKFVALTHPHAYHRMGMSRYFDKFEVKEFWYFHSFIQHTLAGFFKAMHDKGTDDAVEKALDLPSGSVWIDALRLNRAIERQANPIRPRQLITDKSVDLCGGRVCTKFLTPTDDSIWRYNKLLAETTASLLEETARN